MYVYEPAKLIYLAEPRTGSHTMRQALLSMGAKVCKSHHRRLVDEPELREKAKAEGWLVFSSVRNPWDWFVSNYHLNAERRVPFENWVYQNAQQVHSKGKGLLFYRHSPFSTHVIKFERMQEGFDQICKAAGIPSRRLNHENQSKKREERDYREYYNEENKLKIKELFSGEIAKYNYDFDQCLID